MSVQAITWALDFRVRSATEKAILLVLANYANEYGISWPSQPTLAEQSACTERTVRRTVLQQLEARGVVRRVPAPARQRLAAVRHHPARGLRGAQTGAAGPASRTRKSERFAQAEELPPALANRTAFSGGQPDTDFPTPRKRCPPLILH